MPGRHRKPWYTRLFETFRSRASKDRRSELLEDTMDQVTEIVLNCEEEFEDGTVSAEDTVHRLANLLELY